MWLRPPQACAAVVPEQTATGFHVIATVAWGGRRSHLGVEQHQRVLLAPGPGALDGRAPHPQPLGAGAVRGRHLEPAALAEQLVEDEALALPRAAAHRDHPHRLARRLEHLQRLRAQLKLASGSVILDQLQRHALRRGCRAAGAARPPGSKLARPLRLGRPLGRGRSPAAEEPGGHGLSSLKRRGAAAAQTRCDSWQSKAEAL